MGIEIRQLDLGDQDVFRTMVAWYNDAEMRHLFQPNFVETELEEITAEELRYHSLMNSNKAVYLIWDESHLIGEVSLETQFKHLLKTQPATAWISICIGDRAYWGKGVGKLAIIFIEERCRELGFRRIELGVFDYNKRAQQLYKKLGYHPFERIPNFVYYNHQWHADIRMEKYL